MTKKDNGQKEQNLEEILEQAQLSQDQK